MGPYKKTWPVAADDVLEQGTAPGIGAYLVFRRSAAWDDRVMACNAFVARGAQGFVCDWVRCVELPTSAGEFFALPGDAAQRMVCAALAPAARL